MLGVADSEAGVRLLRIQDRRHFQRPPHQQLPPYYHQQHLPNIYPSYPHHLVNKYNQPPPPPRQSRYDESILLNPDRTVTDREVPSDEYLDRDTHRLHQDLYYHANQIPYHSSTPFPFPQHQQVPYHPYPYAHPPQNPPKLLNPDGKLKKKEKKTKSRENLLLNPFNPSHGIIQTEELKQDQKKKQRLLYKRFDSKENSVADNVSIQLLKSNFPQYKQKQILPIYIEESTEESSIIETNEKAIQIDLKTQEKSIQAKQPSPPAKVEPKKEEPKECKDHLFDAFRHSGHLHSRIIDLETYFQILEKQQREGNDNSLLDIAVLNNTNLFPEKPPHITTQIPNIPDVQIHNVSNILFNSNEQQNDRKSNDVDIVYELEEYMPATFSNSLRKSVTISDKPTVLTYSNSLIQPVQHSVANMPIHSITEQTSPIQPEVVVQPIKRSIEPVLISSATVRKEEPQPPIIKPKEEPQKPVEKPPKQEIVEPTIITEDEPRPPFEERIIMLGEDKQPVLEESLPKPYVPPMYLDKVIYIDDLRKKESPKKQESFIDTTPVEIPYYEERVIHIGGSEIPKEEIISLLNDDDNISVTTIGSQETYQDYLQRIGIDIDNMPFSSEAIARKLEMQMAISSRNSLNFSRGSLLLPSDFDDHLMGTLTSTLMRDTLRSTTKAEPEQHAERTIPDDQGPSQTDTIEMALRNILKNSKIKSKLEKLKEANVDISLLNKKNIHIEEIEEYKRLSGLVETEYMKNADYLLAQTEQLKKETREAIDKIDSQLSRKRERFNETIETIYNQRR